MQALKHRRSRLSKGKRSGSDQVTLFDLIEIFMLTHKPDIIVLSLYVETARKSMASVSVFGFSCTQFMGAIADAYADFCHE